MPDKKLAVKTADAIEEMILTRRLPPGTMIGSEAQLQEQFQVSRAVLRESLLILEQRQIATRRRGAGGGLAVRSPDVSSVVRAMALFLEHERVSVDHLVEARTTLEERCAELATAQHNKQTVAQLREIVIAGLASDAAGTIVHLRRFHEALAEATGNPVWVLLTRAIIRILEDYITASGTGPTIQDGRRQLRELGAVVEAIEAGQAEEARKLMGNYVRRVTKRYIAKTPSRASIS